jgi:hypothetical protein
MPSRVLQPLVEVFLLVEQPRQRLSHWSQALAPLDGEDAPPVASVDAYFDPRSNQAIFGLRYDELALGPGRLGFIVEVALLAEIGMIQPAELSDGDRRRFLGERLASCTVHVGDQRKVVAALVELVRRVRSQKGAASTSAVTGIPPLVPRVAAVHEPTDPLVLAAKGTRNGPIEAPVPRSTRDGPPIEAPRPRSTRDGPPIEPLTRSSGELAQGSVRQPKIARADSDGVPESEQKRVISEPIAASPPRLAGALLPQRRDPGQRPSPNVIARAGVHRANTVMMSPSQTQQMLDAANESPDVDPVTDPYLPTTTEVGDGRVIYARYLRAGRWVPLRIGALSLRGAALMAGALPRVDDRVDVALSFANHRALVRGAVAKISSMQEAETSGATTFNVSFELDEASRRELTALLTAARAANVTIKPPPPRSTRRYPVEWPLSLGTARGTVRAEALDVSTEGMFVRPVLPLDASVTFSSVLDDGLPPVSGRARVVRSITEDDARTSGRAAGYGLSILEMPEADRERWFCFVTRIEKRSSARVLIGAAPARLPELQGALVAAGYAVTGASEPGAIAQLASAPAQPVDAALIDAAWLVGGNMLRIESLFASRSIPCVTMHGDARRARIAIDRLLGVV